MISRLLELFLAYEEDANVKLVIVKYQTLLQPCHFLNSIEQFSLSLAPIFTNRGERKSICAGGDVAAVVRDINEGNWRLGANFFRKEFTLNYLMATYSKPQVSILNGIVMGGGAGVSIHGRFRVALRIRYVSHLNLILKLGKCLHSSVVFAMPETALGLFPDVGASYYLSRLPGFFGNACYIFGLHTCALKMRYVGLTGARLDGAEMLTCGLATHFVPSTHPALKDKSAYHRMDVINKCFSRRTVEEIFSALEAEAANGENDWLLTTIQSLKKASPMSLKISLRSIREGRLQGVGQCLVREYRMVCHVMQGEVSKDFREGCRAILLDKDRNPKWEPSKLELINDHMVEQYFSKLDDEEWEELKLPARSKLPVTAIAKL
ncbi:hypothetical protein M0R45_035267 [Rubus argutus]|uniref:3-hydroxyisobutyryl-CoA hydrolase n=1 Tax=Rubus argutus TaxID=59490 RepID=A0AAW1VWA3_RUBAR